MAIWNDLIDQAFVDLLVTQVGESVSAAIRTDAQLRFNQFLSSLSAEGLTAFNQVTQTFNLQPGVTNYQLGSGGSMPTTGNLRAMKVTAWRASYAGVLSSGGRPLSLEEFGAAASQAQPLGESAPVPKILGADTAYPLINVRVLPPPSAAPGTLELAYWTPIIQVADFAAAVSLPDAWQQMLHLNFAVVIAPIYARQGGVSQELAASAQSSKAVIVQQNSMGAPPAQQGQ